MFVLCSQQGDYSLCRSSFLAAVAAACGPIMNVGATGIGCGNSSLYFVVLGDVGTGKSVIFEYFRKILHKVCFCLGGL